MPIFEISSRNGCLFLRGAYFHGCLFSRGAYFHGCLFSRGAYFHGVLINTCNFLVACSYVGTDLAVIYFSPRGSFTAIFCPIFIAFLQPEIQSAIDQSLPTPTHQRKALGTNESVRGFF